jgi:predicted permease
VAQFLTESLVLSGFGCVAGVAMAQWVWGGLDRMVVRSGAPFTPATDWRTLGVACVFALVAGVSTGVGPALLALRGDLTTALRAGARAGTYHPSRTRSVLLVLQGTLSVVLLVGAGLFVRSLENVRTLPLGWDSHSVLIATPNYRGVQFGDTARNAFRRRLLASAQALPGINSAARVNSLPFATNTWQLHVPGVDSVESLGRFNYQATTPDFFRVLGMHVIRGRPLLETDRGETPHVVVVSASMARVLWPGKDPIGSCLRMGTDTMPCTTVVGVVNDVVQQNMSDTTRLMYYISDEQPPFYPANRIFLRVADGNAAAHMESVRDALQRIMPGEAYVTVSLLDDVVDAQRRSWTLGATMFAAFGVLALIVAGVGLHGVIGYTVTQRMHELGVRIALGAQTWDIVRLVVTHGMTFALAGVVSGLAISLLVAPWVEPLLFNQSARDPVIFAVVALVLLVVALAASVAPAIRAIRADPGVALRGD